MTASRSSRRALVLGASVLAALAGSGLASAATLTASAPVQVPDKPLGSACSALVAQQTAAGSVNYGGSEVEPYVAVDPADPTHLVGSFQQDRWNDGGSNGLTNVVSHDGGASWQLAAVQPAFSRCAGAAPGSPGYFMRATDPWVSFSADGKVVYSISDSFDAGGSAFGGASSIIISRSLDGGNTWQQPVTARLDRSTTVLNDKESVTADPFDAKRAYAVWDQLVSPQTNANPDAFLHSIAYRGPSYFSATTDQGATWSNGRIIFDPGQNDQTIGNQIVVPTAGPAKGVLIDGFDLITNKGGKCLFTHGGQHCAGNSTSTAAIVRSADGGKTWSSPIGIDVQQVAPVTIAGHAVRSSDELPEFATNPVTGALYAVWQDGRFANGTSKIAFAQSTDGGLTWSPTIRIDQSPGATPAFVPQIHVSSDGTVALTYYDLQNATTAQPGLTDAFIANCSSATSDCSTASAWAAGGQTRLTTTGSFDYTTAPDAGGYFLGDYTGLTHRGTAFTPFYGMSKPIATAGNTDIFSNSVG